MEIISRTTKITILMAGVVVLQSATPSLSARIFFRATSQPFVDVTASAVPLPPTVPVEEEPDVPEFVEVVSLSFLAVESAAPGSTVLSAPALFSAPEGKHSIVVTGGTVRICKTSDCSDIAPGQGFVGTVQAMEGDYVQIRETAPAVSSSGKTATVIVGDLLTRFLVLT